jgi:uncharacterized protein with ATP-grasp and redox domains
MKMHGECLPCLLRQTLRTARLTHCSHDQQIHILQEVAAVIAGMDPMLSPPANAHPVYRKIAEITGCEDPYYHKKRASNQQALQILPSLRQEIRGTEQELLLAVRFAIAGNIIDYGAFATFDMEAALKRSRSEILKIDHFAALSDALDRLTKGSAILYLADNCGEIVYDALLVEYLQGCGFDVTVAVKEGPIINDALVEDALAAGLDKFGRIITNGGRYPGTELTKCSPQFLEYFKAADLVIAKGQGNFESLSEVDRDIFFLLTIKCSVAAQHMAELTGVVPEKLKGTGEMAVYYSGKKRK